MTIVTLTVGTWRIVIIEKMHFIIYMDINCAVTAQSLIYLTLLCKLIFQLQRQVDTAVQLASKWLHWSQFKSYSLFIKSTLSKTINTFIMAFSK